MRQELVGLHWSPTPWLIDSQGWAICCMPGINDRVDDLPGQLGPVVACKQRLIPDQGVQQQTLVCFRYRGWAKAVTVMKLHFYRAHFRDRVGYFGFETQVNALVGLETKG